MNDGWIGGDIKPAAHGRYEVRFGNSEPATASWDGRVWRHDKLPPRWQRGQRFFYRAIRHAKDATAC